VGLDAWVIAVAAAGLALSLAGCVEEEGPAVSLDPYQWKNRLLLVFAPSPDESGVAEQRRLNAESEPGFVDRDLLEGFLYETAPGTLGGDTASPGFAAEARRQLNVEAGALAVVLVGKDGGVKFRSDRPVPRNRSST
jgi:hypothetical protein